MVGLFSYSLFAALRLRTQTLLQLYGSPALSLEEFFPRRLLRPKSTWSPGSLTHRFYKQAQARPSPGQTRPSSSLNISLFSSLIFLENNSVFNKPANKQNPKVVHSHCFENLLPLISISANWVSFSFLTGYECDIWYTLMLICNNLMSIYN